MISLDHDALGMDATTPASHLREALEPEYVTGLALAGPKLDLP